MISSKSYLNNIVSTIAAVAGFFVILFLTHKNGVGITPDSIAYTGAARQLINAHALNNYNGSPLADFPAFYPLFLAGAMFISGRDVIVIAPFINASLFAFVIFFSGLAINSFRVTSLIFRCILLALIVVSVPLLQVYYMLWSETLFILLTIVFFIILYRYFSSQNWSYLIGAALIAGLSAVTRYAGITLIATGGLLVLCQPSLRIGKRVVVVFVYGIIASGFLTINLIRNFILANTLTGNRDKGITPLATNIYYFGKVITNWFCSFFNNYTVLFCFGLLSIVLFAILFVTNMTKKKNFYSIENISIAFFIIYGSFIIVSSTLSRYDQIDNRLLSPLFIPLLLGSSGWINDWINKLKTHTRQWVFGISILIATAIEINQLFAIPKIHELPSCTNDEWQKSSLVKFLKANPKIFKSDHSIYSNYNAAVYFFIGVAADPLPLKLDKQEVKDFYEEENMYIIWFDRSKSEYDLDLDDILKNKHMTLFKSFDDGSIYVYDENEVSKE